MQSQLRYTIHQANSMKPTEGTNMLSARKASVVIIAAGCALPVIAFFAAHAYVDYVHAVQPTPPNQGAMVIGYLGFMASIPLGLIIAAIGGILLFRSPRNNRAN
jgi:hypothetical protein